MFHNRKIFSPRLTLSLNFSKNVFLVSRHWYRHLMWSRLWRNYEFIITADDEIPIKAWKNCNQFLTHYGEHIRNLKIRFDFDDENRPIQNIQNFLSIFKVIMTKLVKKEAELETIDLSEFRFTSNDCWGTAGKFLIALFHWVQFLQNFEQSRTKLGNAAGVCPKLDRLFRHF